MQFVQLQNFELFFGITSGFCELAGFFKIKGIALKSDEAI